MHAGQEINNLHRCIYLSIIIFLNNTFAFIFQLFKRDANTKYSTVNLINHTELLPTNGENIILGEGSYGRCLLRQYTRFNLKVVEKQSLKQDTTEIIKEAHIMQALAHKNIPTIIGVQLQKQPISLIMEFKGEDNTSVTISKLLSCPKKQ